MQDNSRSLTLTIDAHSGEDLVVLLRQALYEVEKLLPVPVATSSEEAKAHHTARAMTSKWLSDGELKAIGHTEGTLGNYRFEFLRCSRRHYELEKELLGRGFIKQHSDGFLSVGSDYQYVHPTLGKKVITGTPPEIQDAPNQDEKVPF